MVEFRELAMLGQIRSFDRFYSAPGLETLCGMTQSRWRVYRLCR
jgi:hypothetical protein